MSSGASAAAPVAAKSRPGHRAGHTTITAAAMRKVVEAVGATAFGIPAGDVHASLADENGQLSVSLALPVAIPSLLQAARNTPLVHDGGTLYQRAAAARAEIIDRTREVAGTTVGRVDISITGIRKGTEMRVQ